MIEYGGAERYRYGAILGRGPPKEITMLATQMIDVRDLQVVRYSGRQPYLGGKYDDVIAPALAFGVEHNRTCHQFHRGVSPIPLGDSLLRAHRRRDQHRSRTNG